MQTATKPAPVLPSIGFTKDVWKMGRVQLIQFFMYLWGLYQALCGNYQALQAENTRLQEDRERYEDLVRRSIVEYEENLENLRIQLAALEAANDSLKNDAADSKGQLNDLDEYAMRLERELNAIRAEKEAEAQIYYECADERRFSRSTGKKSLIKETNALLKAKSDLEKCRKELSAFKSAVVKMLYDGLPVDSITQYPVRCPVFVVPSLANVDPVILNRGSVLNLESRAQGGKPKFPGAQATTIEKMYPCAGLRTMVDSVREVLTLCGVNLEEE